MAHFIGKCDDRLNIIAFVDYGFGKNTESSNGGNSSKNLLGTGAGLRYTVSSNVNVKFDWGIPLLSLSEKKRQQLYLQALLSF